MVTYPNDRPMDYADHEAVARTSLPIDRPFVLLGESYSGPIAISMPRPRRPGLSAWFCAARLRGTRDRRLVVTSARAVRADANPGGGSRAGSCSGDFRRRGSRTRSLKFSLKSPPSGSSPLDFDH